MVSEQQEISREWWVERWLELLDKYRFKKRLERARVYARQGNVLSIEFREGKVLARVQGTEPEPYQISLFLDQFTEDQWGYVIETMGERAVFSAKLLAGEMPQNIEDVFAKNGLSLFPFTLDEIRSRCSCPDKANPCKHIGAVYYLLADRFAEDPFVLFQLRGRTKEQIVAELRQLRGKAEGESPNPQIPAENLQFSAPEPALKIEEFWHYSEQLEPSLVVIAPPPSSGTVLDVLGAIPLPSDGGGGTGTSQAVMQYLHAVYTQVSQQAILSAMAQES
jgi:uncharacterized Zn finger protein